MTIYFDGNQFFESPGEQFWDEKVVNTQQTIRRYDTAYNIFYWRVNRKILQMIAADVEILEGL